MLTANDEVLGHKLAGEWLERAEARALCSIVFSAMFARDVEIPEEAVERLLHASPTPESIVTLTSAFFAMTAFSAYAAKRDMVELCHRRLEEIVPTHAAHAPVAMAWVVLTRGCYKLHFDRDFWGALRCTRDAVARHEGSGAGPILFGRTLITISCVLLGLFEQANEEAARTVATTPAEGPEALSAEAFLCYVLIAQRRFEDAVALAIRVARGKATMVGGLLGIYARFFQMEAHWFMGDREMAKSEASALSDTMAKEPVFAMWYLAILARMRLDEGRADEAVALAERGYAQSRDIRMGEMRRHALLLLVRAEAHHALGHDDIARDAIREAREDILCRAALIPESESEARQAFLENYPDHKRTLELAREWLGE